MRTQFALFLVVCGLCTFGCSKSGVTVTDENGVKVSTDHGSGKTTYTDDKGNTSTVDPKTGSISSTTADGTKAEMGTNVSEEELGLPFYPGSQPKPNSDFKASSDKEKNFMSNRTTTDAPDKVAEFYKAKLKNANASTITSNNNVMAIITGQLENGGKVSISATQDAKTKETVISIGVGIKLK